MKAGNQGDPLAELVGLMERMGTVTLDSVDAEIEEAELRVEVLRRVRSIVEVCQGKVNAGRTTSPAKRRTPRAEGSKNRGWATKKFGRREQALDWLAANGPAKYFAIADGTGMPRGSVTAAVKCQWFEEVDAGWQLTSAGRTALTELKAKASHAA
jgi:hypothetical protein